MEGEKKIGHERPGKKKTSIGQKGNGFKTEKKVHKGKGALNPCGEPGWEKDQDHSASGGGEEAEKGKKMEGKGAGGGGEENVGGRERERGEKPSLPEGEEWGNKRRGRKRR